MKTSHVDKNLYEFLNFSTIYGTIIPADVLLAHAGAITTLILPVNIIFIHRRVRPRGDESTGVTYLPETVSWRAVTMVVMSATTIIQAGRSRFVTGETP